MAVLGKMKIYCKWADECPVRNIGFFIVDLTSGKVFKKFAADIRQ